jgi:hypothetical protein
MFAWFVSFCFSCPRCAVNDSVEKRDEFNLAFTKESEYNRLRISAECSSISGVAPKSGIDIHEATVTLMGVDG